MEIDVCERNGVTIVKPRGKIIGSASRELRNLIAQQLTDVSSVPHFVFDFAEVELMDSSAIGVLVGTHRTVAPKGGRVALINLSQRVAVILATGKLTPVFEQFDSEDEAVSALTADSTESQKALRSDS